MVEFPIKKQQISTRLSPEELEQFNALAAALFPEQDWTDEAMTLRTIIVRMIEVASNKLQKTKESKPEDLKTIENLQKEVEHLTETIQQQNDFLSEAKETADTQSSIIEDLKNENAGLIQNSTELQERITTISDESDKRKERVLSLEKYVPRSKNEMRIYPEPLTLKILLLYTQKVQTKNPEVTPGVILTSLFNHYNTKKQTQLPGFPFLVSDKEIAQLAKEVENEESVQ